MNLLEKIQALCDQKDITIYKIETETHLTKGSIRKWDTSSPSSDKLLKVANFLNISMETLLSESDLKESIPYEFFKKIIDITNKDLLVWEKFCDLDDETNRIKPNGYNYFDIMSFTEFNNNYFSYDEDNSYFANYKNGGYLLAKMDKPTQNIFRIAFFVFRNSKFFFYATNTNLPMLEGLYELVKSKAMGADDLISEFLNDDFGLNNNDDILPHQSNS